MGVVFFTIIEKNLVPVFAESGGLSSTLEISSQDITLYVLTGERNPEGKKNC